MSKRNYSQYSNKNHNSSAAPIVNSSLNDVVKEVAPEVKMEVETPEVQTETVIEIVTGTVANCAKLNVRVKPSTDAEVACILDAMSEIEINLSKSTPEWFFVTTAIGVEGYCMRKFVEADL